MDRLLKLSDEEIFLFRTRTFNENQNGLSRLFSVATYAPSYSFTSNFIANEAQAEQGKVSCRTPLNLACKMFEVYGKKLESGLVITSDVNFRHEYFVDGSHSDCYNIVETGVAYTTLKKFRKCLEEMGELERVPKLISR